MFRSILFRKLFMSIVVVVIVSSAALYGLSVPMIKKTVYATEEASAKTILNNVYELVDAQNSAIAAYRDSTLEDYKRQLKNITLIQESYIRAAYDKCKQNPAREAETKKNVLEEMRKFRYGRDDYVWVSDYHSVLISHPDPKLHQTDFSGVKDIYGNLIVPPMVAVARDKGEGYTSYWWRRLGENDPVEKLTYSRNFSPWNWVIGTGLYIDDVKQEVDRRRSKMIEELRALLKKTKIARTGYVYIFDSRMNMIIHPNSNIENTNFSKLLDPITGKSIGTELMAVANHPDSMLRYAWDRPEDKSNYIYDKISWVQYYEPFDWYIASSVYLDELNSSADKLRNRVFWVSFGMAVVLIALSVLYLKKMLVPIQTLSKMTVQVEKGDLDARCQVSGNDEISVLAAGFNRMVGELKSFINELDNKVIERTREAEEKNSRLQCEIDERSRVSEQLETANAKLTTWVKELETRNREIALLNRMGDMLQACRTLDETFGVITETLGGLLPSEPGGLYMLRSSKNLLELVAKWGDFKGCAEMFPPEECWGLRRGKAHRVEKPGMGQACAHIRTPPPFGALCVPMMGQGEVLGMLHLSFSGPEPDQRDDEHYRRLESMERLAMTVADHLSLALANLKLRERLQELSVRDPLTGLYNRRYMQETLEREIKRAQRTSKPIGIIMLDVDHFKAVNDTYGHDAGDVVLKTLARFLTINLRGEDVACRYGGEEFILIMPGLSLTDSEHKAEHMRQEIENTLRVQYLDKSLSITVSIGVAAFPEQGGHADHLITQVDEAMYAAKTTGRNRIVTAGK
ncbi:cache domain-containing protein [uncultured Desulfosarcina sp.]|uniref:cache domain-containing protein n=1 Tax=uncultured Desulfosarcina sp. TaxID=218289 RepID=UPI0029C649FD|nr:cache domain-containing protein [uncultured Desulfosarcina sp.]